VTLGGGVDGGLGGEATTAITVTPGAVLQINGGGASDVRQGGIGLANRVVIVGSRD
jgi:hypothetical protein